MSVNIDVILRLVDKLSAPAKSVKAAVNGIKDATGKATQTAKQAANATRGLTRTQIALGRGIITTRRRLLADLPKFEAAGQSIGRGLRFVGLGLSDTIARSVQFSRQAATVSYGLAKRVVAIAGLSVGGALAAMRSYAKATAAQIKFGKQTGFTVQALRELSSVAESQGIPLGTFERSIEGLQKRLGELKRGKGALAKLYQQINPRLYRQLRSERNPEKSLEAILNDIARVKDPSKRQLLAQTAFGEGGSDMVKMAMMTPAERLAERDASRRRRGVLTPEDLDNADALDTAFGHVTESIMGLRDAIANALAPVVTPILRQFSEWLILNRQLIASGLKSFVLELRSGFGQIDFKGFVNDIRSMVQTIDSAVRSTVGWKTAILVLLAIPFASALIKTIRGIWLVLKGAVLAIAWLSRGLAPLLAIYGTAIASGIAIAAKSVVGTIARLGLSIVALVGGWPVVIAAAIGVGIMAAFRNWDSIKAWIASLVAMLPQGIQNALNGLWDSMTASVTGRLVTAVGKPILQWVSDLVDGMIAAAQGNIDQLTETLLRPFKTLWEYVSGLVGRIGSAISSALQFKLPSLPSWLGSSATPSSAAPADKPQTLGDVVNEIDNSRQTTNDVKVQAPITIHVQTNASPASIGSAVAGAVTSTARRAFGGLHDGGAAGPAFQGAP